MKERKKNISIFYIFYDDYLFTFHYKLMLRNIIFIFRTASQKINNLLMTNATDSENNIKIYKNKLNKDENLVDE